MQANVRNSIVAVGLAVLLAGCGSAYSGLADHSGVGAGQYMPAVYVKPENKGTYQQVLALCRQAAANRQATRAQMAQLESLTGVVKGAGTGAATGLVYGNLLGSAGLDTGALKSAGIGAVAGVLSAVVSGFASGAKETALETRKSLLNCLRNTSRGGTLWQVLE